MTRRFRALFFVFAALWPRHSTAEQAPSEPEARPTLVWILTQLIPSPEVAAGTEGTHFGLRWQVTPILYSFGINSRLSPWRALVVEPIVRQSGSIELFLSPEVFTGSLFQAPLVRAGVRSYFPLVAKGEELSVSLGTSYTNMNGQNGVGWEAGAYILYGTVGIQVTYAPAPSPVQWITTLRIRYF
jgi:hypothetical protein